MQQDLRSVGPVGAAVVLLVGYVVSFSVTGLGLYQLQLIQEHASRLTIDPSATRHSMEMPEIIVFAAFFGVVPTLAALALGWHWTKAEPLWGTLAGEVLVGAVSAGIAAENGANNQFLGVLVAPFVLPLVLIMGVILARRQDRSSERRTG